MAQLNSSVVQGSLRVTDTTYTTDLNLASATASQFVKTDANKNLVTTTLSKSDVGLNNVTNDAQVKASLGTTKGDMLYWTGNAAPARLALGTAGYTLQATANGPAWTQTVAVANGGTGTNSFTANSLIMSGNTTTAALTTRAIVDRTSVNALTALTTWTANTGIPTVNLIAHWDGRYQTTNNSSNLAYCNKGAFGNMAIKTKGNGFSDSSNTISVAYGTSANTAVEGNQKIFTLNGSDKNSGSSNTSFYAPITYGTAGYILKANGESEAPFWVEKVSYNNLPTNDSFILTEGDNSANPPATAQATIPSNYALNRKIFYSQDTPSVTDTDLGMFWFQPASFTMEDLKCLIVGVVATNTTSVTINNDDITTDMVVVKCVLSNPSAQVGDLTWTTTGKDPEDPNSRGNIVVNGTINGTTSMTFYLIHAR